jgi:hypothetical protein
MVRIHVRIKFYFLVKFCIRIFECSSINSRSMLFLTRQPPTASHRVPCYCMFMHIFFQELGDLKANRSYYVGLCSFMILCMVLCPMTPMYLLVDPWYEGLPIPICHPLDSIDTKPHMCCHHRAQRRWYLWANKCWYALGKFWGSAQGTMHCCSLCSWACPGLVEAKVMVQHWLPTPTFGAYGLPCFNHMLGMVVLKAHRHLQYPHFVHGWWLCWLHPPFERVVGVWPNIVPSMEIQLGGSFMHSFIFLRPPPQHPCSEDSELVPTTN